jgi:hypothetical protein
MREDFKNFFTHLTPRDPSAGLFDRIILAIRREQKQRQTKKLFGLFLSLLLISLVATPLSGILFAYQIKNSGILYFISMAMGDLKTFFAFWQEFSLAILESLPLGGMILFSFSLAISVFTLRLFLHKKRLLFSYIFQSFNI